VLHYLPVLFYTFVYITDMQVDHCKCQKYHLDCAAVTILILNYVEHAEGTISCNAAWKFCVMEQSIRGVSKKFRELYQKTNKTEDTNKLTLLAFKIIAILLNTLLATFICGGNPRTCDSGSAIGS
jgi:type IV secretory pathway component VirB8